MPRSPSHFSRWLAPLVGAVLGLAIGISEGDTTEERAFIVIGGAGIGFIAGLILILVDRDPADTELRRGSTLGRFWAFLALLLAIVPLIGLVVITISAMVNRGKGGFPRWSTRVAVPLSILSHFIVMLKM